MKIKLLTFFGMLTVAAFALWTIPTTASAQGNTDAPQNPSTEQTTTTPEAYTYTAQTGDSYSVLARKAIQTYGIETQTNLSGAQIVFAETNLTQEAGSELLETGQTVTITKADVQKWVDKAKDLTDSQKAAWQYYVSFVDFNTDAFGES